MGTTKSNTSKTDVLKVVLKPGFDRLRKEVYGFYAELGIPEHLADRYWLKEPDIAVRFAVDKIFVQTPGPDAGKQVY